MEFLEQWSLLQSQIIKNEKSKTTVGVLMMLSWSITQYTKIKYQTKDLQEKSNAQAILNFCQFLKDQIEEKGLDQLFNDVGKAIDEDTKKLSNNYEAWLEFIE